VRKAETFGDRCMQQGTMAMVDVGTDLGMSEDCLYLNIWRPKKEGKFPVMIWIHGGGYTGGTGSTPMYYGDRLAAAGDVVVVTINYRLNIFGFLAARSSKPRTRTAAPALMVRWTRSRPSAGCTTTSKASAAIPAT